MHTVTLSQLLELNTTFDSTIFKFLSHDSFESKTVFCGEWWVTMSLILGPFPPPVVGTRMKHMVKSWEQD